MKLLIRLHSEEKVAELSHHFDNLATVVSQALGGSDDSGDTNDAQEIGSFAELAQAFRGLGGQVGG